MTPRLKEILERRKAKADTQNTTEQEVSEQETPALILVPSFDCITDDEFSPYF